MTLTSDAAVERRIAWLEASAARCAKVHPDANFHKLYRRNAAALRAAIKTGADTKDISDGH